jgi:hypothetical protein
MLDAEYFRTQLDQDIAAVGGEAIVELRLLSRQSHRLRAVARIAEGYVVVEAFQSRAEDGMRRDDSAEQAFGRQSSVEVERATVPFESIVDVVVTPSTRPSASRIGFPTR